MGAEEKRGTIQQTSFFSLLVFSAGGHVSSSSIGGEIHSDVVHPAFSPLTTASPTLGSVLKGCFGAAVVVRDVSEPCELPSPDSYQKRCSSR